MQNMRGTEQVGRGDNQPAIDAMIVPSRAGRASLWARSRPCIVVGTDLTMRRPAGLLDLRRRCPPLTEAFEAFEACFGVLPALSSSSPGVDVAPGGAPPPRRLRGRASRGGLRGGRRQPRAGHRRGVRGRAAPLLGLPPSSWHQRAAASGAAFYHLDVFAGNV